MPAAMISDRDIWAAALNMIKRYADDAGQEAARRADQLHAGGGENGAETWHRILAAIERIRAHKSGEGGWMQ